MNDLVSAWKVFKRVCMCVCGVAFTDSANCGVSKLKTDNFFVSMQVKHEEF